MKLALAVVLAALLGAPCGGTTTTRLDLNDVTWLWPVPENQEELADVISIDLLQTVGGEDVWSDEQFADLLRVADSDASRVGNQQIQLPAEVRQKSVWKIVAFRVDPTAPGGHEIIRNNFGEQPQLRLVLQPVTLNGNELVVHDIAAHLVYNFLIQEEGGPAQPDRDRFQQIVTDLDQLKAWGQAHEVFTTGEPLGVHPGLRAKVPELGGKVRHFLATHLRAEDLSAMALMGLNGPEPWIFVAMSKFPPGAARFGPVPFLPAQMLSFREGPGVIAPSPVVNNLNAVPSRIPMPASPQDRRGVATAVLFADATIELDQLAVIGTDEAGQPVRDSRIRNRDIPDIIADPTWTAPLWAMIACLRLFVH